MTFGEVIVNGDSAIPVASASAGAEDNSSSTNETVNTAHSDPAASTKDQASTASYADDVIFSFFSNQSNCPAPTVGIKNLELIDVMILKKWISNGKWQCLP
ncbi:hypothetical protein Tco_0367993 [Tanacetum coccineum]